MFVHTVLQKLIQDNIIRQDSIASPRVREAGLVDSPKKGNLTQLTI